jgi:hypothetical protein
MTVATPLTTITVTTTYITTSTSITVMTDNTTATDYTTDTDTTTATNTVTNTDTTTATTTETDTETSTQATASVFAMQATTGNYTFFFAGLVSIGSVGSGPPSPEYKLSFSDDPGSGMWEATSDTNTFLYSVNQPAQTLEQFTTDSMSLRVADAVASQLQGLVSVMCSIDFSTLGITCEGPSGATYGWCQCDGDIFLCTPSEGICPNGIRDEFTMNLFYIGATT